MNKRPLCLIFLVIATAIWLFDLWGNLTEFGSPQKHLLQTMIQNERRCRISGEVFRKEVKTTTNYIYLKNINLNVQSEQFSPDKAILKYEAAKAIEIGNILTAEGTLEAIAKPANPGQFDAAAYYAGMNIEFFVAGRAIEITDPKEALLRSGLLRIREQFCQKLVQLAPQNAGVLAAMLLGEKGLLEDQQKDRFQMSGIAHILAISGLHLSLLGMGLYRLLIRLGIYHKPAGAAVVLLLVLYTVLTGESVSTLRALLMFAIFIGSRICGRTYDVMSALSLSGSLILVEYPRYLYYCGFLLSFGAVAALGGVLPCFIKTAEQNTAGNKILARVKRQLRSGLKSGAVIAITTLPLVLYFFYEVSVYGILVNLIIIPTAGLVLLSGFAGGMLGFISIPAGQAAIIPAALLLELYDRIGSGVQKLPFATLILGRPQRWQMISYYIGGIILILVWKRIKRPGHNARLLLSAGLGVMIAVLTLRVHRGLSITALDVGQGDGLVVTTESNNVYLIDGGSSSIEQVGRYRIIPFLKSQGIRELEAVLISHPDEDHLNGVMELLEAVAEARTSLRVKRCLLPVWMAAAADDAGISDMARRAGATIDYLQAGDSITDGNTSFTVLHPDNGDYQHNINAGSLTFLLEYGGFCGLFTGDLGGAGEAAVKAQLPVCDFLKVAHHGSRDATDAAFLARVQPRVSVISCARNNRYGHPHPDLRERLEQLSDEIYLTMESGAVTVWTDGQEQLCTRQFQPVWH